jgi:leucyl-tRNA synthetase
MTDSLDWPERIKLMQKNWIGKSYGTDIDFEINGKKWSIFTTRPDTIYGVTFMVVSAQHPKLMELVTKEQKKEVEAFLKKIKSTSEKDMEELEKEGAFTGSYAVNPLTKDKIPVYAGNFVIAEYGSGMVMAVPAHDQRDFEFAKKYKIPIKVVINPEYELKPEKMARAYTEEGKLVNSGEFNGINSKEAIDKISKHLEKKKLGKITVQYKLRDWLVSRQRYWGTPIPFVYCDKCGLVPVPEKELPIILPENVKFGEGNPLETNKEFVNAKCPKCGGKARRETDTMDTFFDSSWYFLRFCDNKNNREPFANDKARFWMPVDLYIGGAEHACMHLIYARFFVKALRDLGLLNFDEPFTKLYNQGMLHGTDGAVMSKSRGNVVLPEEISKKYGIDTARVFLMFVASPDKDMLWDDKGISGCSKFMNKVISLFEKKITNEKDSLLESKTNRTIKEVTEKIESMQYNVALIDLMELVKFLSLRDTVTKESLKALLLILSPFCPHVCEELWEKLGNRGFIAAEKWPSYDEKKINLEAEYLEDIIVNTKADVITVLELAKIEKPKEIKLFVGDDWKYKLYKIVADKLSETRDVGEIQKSVMATELKKFGKDIVRMIPRIIENPPKIVLNQEKELKKIKESKERIEKEFKCKVEVIKEADSKEQKARQALPGKPAIIIS